MPLVPLDCFLPLPDSGPDFKSSSIPKSLPPSRCLYAIHPSSFVQLDNSSQIPRTTYKHTIQHAPCCVRCCVVFGPSLVHYSRVPAPSYCTKVWNSMLSTPVSSNCEFNAFIFRHQPADTPLQKSVCAFTQKLLNCTSTSTKKWASSVVLLLCCLSNHIFPGKYCKKLS